MVANCIVKQICIILNSIETHIITNTSSFLEKEKKYKTKLFRKNILCKDEINKWKRDRRGRDHMVVGFITTYAIGAYHH